MLYVYVIVRTVLLNKGENIMRLEGKIGLVTAAGSGMGRAGAIRFAQEGALVGVADVDEDAVASVVSEIEENGGKAKGIVADLTKDADSKRIVFAYISGGRISCLPGTPVNRLTGMYFSAVPRVRIVSAFSIQLCLPLSARARAGVALW